MRPLPALQQLRQSTLGSQVQEFTATLQQTHDGNDAQPFLLSDSRGPILAIEPGDSPGSHTEGMPPGVIRSPGSVPIASSALLYTRQGARYP